MFQKLMPKEHKFFELFEQQVATIQEGLDLFGALLNDYGKRDEYRARIKDIEHRADKITHEVLQMLANTFVTPFDREDIQTLVHRLDDVIDLVEATSARMEIYDIKAPTDEVREMSRILRHAFRLVSMGIKMLNNLKQREQILRICVDVNSLENEGDTVLRLSLHRLFENATDPFYVIKMKEIYENLERAIDRCEDVADLLETILVKNA